MGCIIIALITMGFLDYFRRPAFLAGNIGKLKARKDLPGLIRALRVSDPEIQYHAAEALGELRDPSAAGALAETLGTTPHSGVRWKAAEALSRLGESSVDCLVALLDHKDEDVRWKSAIALGELRSRKSVPALVRLLDDKDHYVRSRAASALGMMGEDAVDLLIPLIHDSNSRYRWGAVYALGKICSERAAEPLVRALADPHPEVRAEAVASLAAIGKPAIPPLVRFLKYTRGEERIEIISVLGELRSSDAIEPIIQLLESAEESERMAIAETLDAILIPEVESHFSLAGRQTETTGTNNSGEDVARGEDPGT
jgi:HEAT repeat protein